MPSCLLVLKGAKIVYSNDRLMKRIINTVQTRADLTTPYVRYRVPTSLFAIICCAVRCKRLVEMIKKKGLRAIGTQHNEATGLSFAPDGAKNIMAIYATDLRPLTRSWRSPTLTWFRKDVGTR